MESFISLILAAASFAADRKIKQHIEDNFEQGQTKELCDGRLLIKKAVNRGFAMNKLEGRRTIVLGVSAVIFFIGLTVYAWVLIKPQTKAIRIGMGLLMGGAAGNVYDRWKKQYVVDYLQLGCFKKVIFNLADVLIVTGALITAAAELLGGR